MLIYESTNFLLETAELPLVCRNDGGHTIINPKIKVATRQELRPKLAIELMRLTIVAGSAMTTALIKSGIDIGRINYQDNGNWAVFLPEGPTLHIHLYGRAKNAIHQKYGDACFFPQRGIDNSYYKNFKPLNYQDAVAIKEDIEILLKEKHFSDKEWGLT